MASFMPKFRCVWSFAKVEGEVYFGFTLQIILLLFCIGPF